MHAMDNVLQTLYNGEIFPANQYIPQWEEYKALQEKQYQRYADFVSKLDPPLDREFKQIIDEQFDLLPYEWSQMFIDGFRLGAKMMIEVYEDNHPINPHLNANAAR